MRTRRRSARAPRIPLLAAAAAAVQLARTAVTPVDISPALNASDAGDTLSQTLLPSYAGIGIEPSNLPAFTGTTEVNPLTYGCLATLANFTGVPSHLRVGGNTGDNALYSPNATGYTFTNNATGPASLTANWYYGPELYTMLDRLPKGTPITFGLNLAYNGSDSVDRIVQQAAATLDLLHNVTVAGFEVGNEPDLYVKNNYRPAGYSEAQYGAEWIQRVQAIHQRVLTPRNLSSDMFEVAVTATTADQNGHPFRVANLVGDARGLASGNGIYISGWNQHDYTVRTIPSALPCAYLSTLPASRADLEPHCLLQYYIGVSGFPMTSDWLLDFDNTYDQFTEWAAQAQQAKVTGKPYYLREMGSIGPEGIQGISDSFANTLWTFNFFLYAATAQVNSVQLHSTQTSYSAPWQPISILNTPPHVRSCYYAYAAIAQLIGAQCSTRVASINPSNTPSGYDGRLAAYAIYTANDLTGLALINSQTSNTSNPTGNSIAFTFSLPELAGQTFYLSHLTAAGTDATSNTTWNGLSFETLPNGKPQLVNDTLQTAVADSSGTVSISVADGSALVANLGSRLGSNPVVNQTNCDALNHNEGPSGTNGGSAATFSATHGFKKEHKGLSTGAIVALAVAIPCGVIALLIVCGLLIWFMCRRRRRAAQAGPNGLEKGTKSPPTDGTYASNTSAPDSQSQDSAARATAQPH